MGDVGVTAYRMLALNCIPITVQAMPFSQLSAVFACTHALLIIDQKSGAVDAHRANSMGIGNYGISSFRSKVLHPIPRDHGRPNSADFELCACNNELCWRCKF